MAEFKDAKNPLNMKDMVWRAAPQKWKDAVLEVVARYGDNKWWLSKDPMEAARYQIFEDALLVDYRFFHKGLEKLLGRKVFEVEFGFNAEGIQEEAQQAIEARDAGTFAPPTEKEAVGRVLEAFILVQRFAEENGKELIPKPQNMSEETVMEMVKLSILTEMRRSKAPYN